MAISKIQHVVSLDVFDKLSDLPEEEVKLMREAEKASERAYAPYSQFRVGAAVLLDNGLVVSGNNQENAAYPSGLCAERVALFFAMAQHPGVVVRTLAIVCHSESSEPVTPCGACRQVIAEYEQKQNGKIRILMGVPGRRVYAAGGIQSLLPFMFGSKDLKK
jgi:cytidine deaminase